ncbi:cilia- and flagella-associated protein 58 [Uranotaenia lowii]|uniref:cilia- and flagella-associated protein 58 n=1 Tax=Uranotaenia lowii TaxID=190385 RepID=UPI00247A9CF1|nr:cilia- and flagella-associated protein 58 [Uranotaenia lowii]XP_055588244.1 cilia- and flagella-associated protein 58 [Uranotaenia lowii]
MDQIVEESGEDSQAPESAFEDDLIPKEITDEFFEELCTKSNLTVKDLQGNQQYGLAEDFQKLLLVGQQLRSQLLEEQERIEKMLDEVTAAAERVSQAVAMSQRDQDTIEALRSEIEGAWKRADAAQTREQTAQEAMNQMRQKLDKLTAESDRHGEKEDEVGAMMGKHKENILRERDRLFVEVEELNRRLQTQRVYAEELELKCTDTELKVKELYKMLDETSNEAFRDKRMLENLQFQHNEVVAELEVKTQEADHFKTLSESSHRTTVQQGMQIAAIRTSLERMTTSSNLLKVKLAKAQGDFENMVQLKEKVTNELNTKVNILKLKEDENNKYRLENAKLVKKQELLMKKILTLETTKSALDQEVLKLKNTILTFEKERDASKKAFDAARKQVDAVLRERDLARKELVKANKLNGDLTEAYALSEKQHKTLENEIKAHVIAAQKQTMLMIKIEKDRDRNAEEAQNLHEKMEQANEDLLYRQNQIMELREKLRETEGRLFQCQTTLEMTRSERNIFERDLATCTKENEGLKERLKTCGQSVSQLKDENTTKVAELFKACKTIDKIEKEKQSLKNEVQNISVTLQHTKSELNEKIMENSRLNKTLTDDATSMLRLKKQLDGAINEKDLIKQQLTQRVDEINSLLEKQNMLNMALDRGESQYRDRLDDIRLLKIEISNLRSQRNLLARGLANTADMRQEVLQMHRVLNHERVKARALEDEMMTPMNVHRWRKLTGKDPEKMDLIVKVQTLQRRVLFQSVTVTQQEKTIDESEKMYGGLKEVVEQLPNQKMKEQLCTTQRVLTAKTKKLKALAAEVRAKEMDTKSQECLVEELKKSLLETKKELVKEKREKQKLLESARGAYIATSGGRRLSSPNSGDVIVFQQQKNGNSAGYRMVGAGFKVSC